MSNLIQLNNLAGALNDNVDEQERLAAEFLTEAHKDTQIVITRGIRQVVALGLFLQELKEWGKRTGKIPHGQFQKWLEQHCPEVSIRTCKQWMQTSKAVLGLLGLDEAKPVANLGMREVLSLPAEELPAPARKVQEQVWDLVDGRSQHELVLKFKDTQPAPRQHHPPKKSPEELAAEELVAINLKVRDVCQDIHWLIDEGYLRKAGDKERALFEEAKNRMVYELTAIRGESTEKGAKGRKKGRGGK